MKKLIFIGLVLGASSYLLSSHSTSVATWLSKFNTKAVVTKTTQHLASSRKIEQFENQLSQLKIQVSKLTDQLKENVQEQVSPSLDQLPVDLSKSAPFQQIKTEAKPEKQEKVLAVNEKQKTQSAITLDDFSTDTLVSQSMQTQAIIPAQVEASAPVAQEEYMPVAERSAALMELVQRMEMRAAGF